MHLTAEELRQAIMDGQAWRQAQHHRLVQAANTLEWLATRPHIDPATSRQIREVVALCLAQPKP